MRAEETELKGRRESGTEFETAEGTLIDPATELPVSAGDAEFAEASKVKEPGVKEPGAKEPGATEPGGRSEVEELKAEREQLVDRLARMQAEFDNARKRAEREQLEFRDFATGSVVEKFLPVMDNFGLALRSTGSVQQLRSGVDLIVKQMEEVLRQMHVTPVAAVGEHFDPRVHEALGAEDRDDVPDQQIIDEVRRGYKLRERLLRPALVRVAHNSKQISE
jgi:molecular chaperone GrpE